MTRTALVAATAAAVVFAAVGFLLGANGGRILSHPHNSDDCRGRDCVVTIKFDCTLFTCEPFADKEVILVTPNHKIQFDIDSSKSYEFETDGIKFTSANANGWFDCQPQGKTQFKCDIKTGTPPDLYKYWIKIKTLKVVDPWVVNY